MPKEYDKISFQLDNFSRDDAHLVGPAIFKAIDYMASNRGDDGSPDIEFIYWHKNYSIPPLGSGAIENAKDYISFRAKYWANKK